MKRSKEEINFTATSGTPEERVLLIKEDYEYKEAHHGKGFLTQKEISALCSVSEEDVEEYRFYISRLQSITKRKAVFIMYENQLSNYATLINHGLELMDIYTTEAYLLNDLIQILIKEYGVERTELALDGEAELPQIGAELIKRIKNHRSIDKKVTLEYSKEKKRFILDVSELAKYVEDKLENFRYTLKQAKSLELMLEAYTNRDGVKHLIPDSIITIIEHYKSNWSANQRFTPDYYNNLLKSDTLESLIEACRMEDNGELRFIFPSYDDIEVKPEEIKYNIFDNG